MKSKELFNEVFEEIDLDTVENIDGGKWTAAQCAAAAIACAASVGCGGSIDATLCDAVMKNCYGG